MDESDEEVDLKPKVEKRVFDKPGPKATLLFDDDDDDDGAEYQPKDFAQDDSGNTKGSSDGQGTKITNDMLHESLSQKLKPLSAPEEEKGEPLD